MAKPYSQDLRDRVIDAVEREEMSRRAAARRYEISESVAIKWLERVEWKARESLMSLRENSPTTHCAAYLSPITLVTP
jgi:transposase